MTMDRCGVNEYIDDDYSNSTCDCKYCLGELRKVTITSQVDDDILEFEDDYDGFDFELQWSDTQKPEPKCDCLECRLEEAEDIFLHAITRYDECDCEEPCEVCTCDDGIMIDLEDEIQAAEFCEVLAEDVESAMIEVLYAFETGEPKGDTLKKIDELRDLLYVMECVVVSEE